MPGLFLSADWRRVVRFCRSGVNREADTSADGVSGLWTPATPASRLRRSYSCRSPAPRGALPAPAPVCLAGPGLNGAGNAIICC